MASLTVTDRREKNQGFSRYDLTGYHKGREARVDEGVIIIADWSIRLEADLLYLPTGLIGNNEIDISYYWISISKERNVGKSYLRRIPCAYFHVCGTTMIVPRTTPRVQPCILIIPTPTLCINFPRT